MLTSGGHWEQLQNQTNIVSVQHRHSLYPVVHRHRLLQLKLVFPESCQAPVILVASLHLEDSGVAVVIEEGEDVLVTVVWSVELNLLQTDHVRPVQVSDLNLDFLPASLPAQLLLVTVLIEVRMMLHQVVSQDVVAEDCEVEIIRLAAGGKLSPVTKLVFVVTVAM